MKVVQITKKTNSKTEQMELLIAINCLLNKISLSETEVSVLAHFVIFGIKKSTDKLLINSGVVNNATSLRNIKYCLKKKDFLRRDKDLYNSYQLNMSDGSFLNEDVIRLDIKLDNTES